MSLKTAAGIVVIALLIWWAAEQPTTAAHAVHNVGHFMAAAARGISHFFKTA